MTNLDDYVSTKEACRQLGKRYGQIMRLIRAKKLDAIKPEGAWGWLVSKESVQRLKAQTNEADRIPA
jgi:excisionase family DNA binding protein